MEKIVIKAAGQNEPEAASHIRIIIVKYNDAQYGENP